MTKLSNHGLETTSDFSSSVQDEKDRAPVVLTSDERNALAVSMAAAARGEFATDAEVKAVWAKYGL